MKKGIEKSKFIWLNGKFVPWDKAQVHFLTHALHYGSGVFEGIRCYNTLKGPAVFRLKDHLHRLYDSALIIEMKIPFPKEKLYKAILELVRKNKMKECYIRPLVFYGYGRMGINPLGIKPMAGIACWKWGTYLGKEALEKGIRAGTSSWQRIGKQSMPTQAKATGNYINSILAKIEAINEGYEEAIMLDGDGNVAEASAENVFMVRENALITPPETNILEGITRKSIMEIARNGGIEVKEELFTRDQLYTADEAFLTGTAAELTPIREIDGRRIGDGKPGKITVLLQKKFFDIARGKNPDYFKWLDFV